MATNIENLTGIPIARPQQEFAESRLDKLNQAIDKVREKYPEVLGAVGFGSLFRGDSTVDSDIDLQIVIDLSKSPSIAGLFKLETSSIAGKTVTALSEAGKQEYIDGIRKILLEEMDIESEKLEHIFLRVVSDEIITESLKWLSGKVKLSKLLAQQQKCGYEDMLSRMLHFDRPISLTILENLTRIFLYDIGDGNNSEVQKIRELILNRLQEMGQETQTAFQVLIKRIQTFYSLPKPKGDEEDLRLKSL